MEDVNCDKMIDRPGYSDRVRVSGATERSVKGPLKCLETTFTFINFADTLIQSDLHCITVILLLSETSSVILCGDVI